MRHEIAESRRIGKRGTPALVCWPQTPGKFGCVIVLHERYGFDSSTEIFARRLAADGFVAVAPDLFHTFADQAALRAGTVGVNPTDNEVLEACEDAFSLFSEVDVADSSRFGMIGVCQTGRYPLVWGTKHPIQAAITLYGAAGIQNWERNDQHPDGIDGVLDKMSTTPDLSILGLFGEDDHVISIDDVLRFRNAIEERNLSYQISIYPQAPHGWLNETMPGRYRADAAAEAWNETILFLNERFATGGREQTVKWSFRSTRNTDYDYAKKTRQA